MIKNKKKCLFWIISLTIIIAIYVNDSIAQNMIETPYGPVKPLDFNKYKEYYAGRSFFEYEGSEFGAGVVTDLVLSLTEENIKKKRGETTIKDEFVHFCGPCHGENGNGEGQFAAADLSPKPTNLSDISYMGGLNDTHISSVITGGSIAVGKSNLCPPWGNTFDKELIDNMTVYIRTLSSGNVEKAVKADIVAKTDVNGENASKDKEEGGGGVTIWIILGFATAFFVGVAVLEWSWLSKNK